MIIPGILAQRTASGPAGDPYFANVKLLTHLNGSEGGTSFIDVTGKTITASGAVVTQSSGAKFGQCAAFSGGSLYLADSDDWHWTGVDFTVEFFISAPTPAPAGDWGLLSQSRLSGAGELVIAVDFDRKIRFYSENPTSGSEVLTSSDALAVDTMQHIAICRVGSTTRIFIDGVQKASGTFNGGVDMPSGLYVGRHFYAGSFLSGRDFPGKLDEIRITKGVGRYTTAFTPPSSPFPDS